MRPIEQTSSEYQTALAAVRTALDRCREHSPGTVGPFHPGRSRRPSDDCWDDVHAAVESFCRAAREDGELPEHALLRIKSISRDNGRAAADSAAALGSQVARRCIEAYFGR